MPTRRPKILFVRCWDPNEGQRFGGGQRLATLERSLKSIGDVRFVQAQRWDGPTPWPVTGKTTWFNDASNAAASTWNLPQHRPPPEFANAFAALQPETYDVVFLHRLATCWWTGWTDPNRTIVDLDDIPSQYFKHAATHGGLPARLAKWVRYHRVRLSEQRVLNAFRFALVCSELDHQYLNHPRVEIVPNCYWPHIMMGQSPADVAPSDEASFLFIGALDHPPNEQGVAWFVDRVLPLIRNRLPHAKLRIIGRPAQHPVTDSAWAQALGVEHLGPVDDVGPYIQATQVEICPLLDGRGTRIKILESLAFGKPIVSTSIGAYGLPMGPEEGLCRGDTPEGFARHCIDLITDHAKRTTCGRAGRAYVRQHYSPQAVEQKLHELVELITDNRLKG